MPTLKSTSAILFFLAYLLLQSPLVAEETNTRRYPSSPEGLPLMDTPPHQVLTKDMPKKVEVLLPNQLRLQKITSAMDLELKLESHSGNAYLICPKEGRINLGKEPRPLKAWDRLVTENKSEVRISSSDGDLWALGSNGLLQIMKQEDGSSLVRLLKGRLRIKNINDDSPIKVETLNAMLSIPSGVTDVIISAMNTLVAPREGSNTKVTTSKTRGSVSVGQYGFITHDGSLLFSKGQ
jgi:hypothetical protein